jgi:hypothetical protein
MTDEFTRGNVRSKMEREHAVLGEKLDRLAARLGVTPHVDEQGPTWLVKFGKNSYDVFFLIGALLDRLEDAEQRLSGRRTTMTNMTDEQADKAHIAGEDGRWRSPDPLPTPYEDELLTCLIEEMLEVGKRACKTQRFGATQTQPGHTDTNVQRMSREWGQLLYVWDRMREVGLVDYDQILAGYGEKGPKLDKFMQTERPVMVSGDE